MKPVSKEVRKALPLLKFLAKVPNKKIRKYNLNLLGGDETVFDALKEISGNYLNGKIKLNPRHSKIVSKDLKLLKKFHCNKIRKNCNSRKNILRQSGGFLPFLIPAAASIIEIVLSKYLK
jgi:hypothetical protein